MKNEGKKWTNEEIVLLQEKYPKYGAEYCANILERGKKAVIKKANLLKIKFEKIRFKYLKENIEPLVKESKSISDVIRKMGLKAAGGNHRVIKSYVEKYNMDISHFINDQAIKNLENYRKNNTIKLEDILIENSTYNRTHLKERLYKEGLKNRKCEDCGQEEIWHGKHMSLILDHKNGINNDNRFINLRILCPNCASTLPTHAGKNKYKSTR